MRLVTWNTAHRADTRSQAEFLRGLSPDVVALQEVIRTSLRRWKPLLKEIGLPIG